MRAQSRSLSGDGRAAQCASIVSYLEKQMYQNGSNGQTTQFGGTMNSSWIWGRGPSPRCLPWGCSEWAAFLHVIMLKHEGEESSICSGCPWTEQEGPQCLFRAQSGVPEKPGDASGPRAPGHYEEVKQCLPPCTVFHGGRETCR